MGFGKARIGRNREWIPPTHDLDFAVEMLDQRRTSLDPIAAVVIGDVAEFMDGSTVDVSAKNAVHPIAFRVFNHSCFKLADETDRVLHALFYISTERPVTEAKTSPDEINEWVK